MDSLIKTFLREGSYFLPIVERENLETVASLINQSRLNPIPAIAMESHVLIGRVLERYRSEKEIINKLYKVTMADINLFFQGYSTPIIILLNSCKDNMDKVESDILSLAEPITVPDSPLTQNKYILRAIFLYTDMLKSSTQLDFMANVSTIFDFCEKEPLFKNKYYNLGIIAAKTVYREFYTRINLTPTAFTY